VRRITWDRLDDDDEAVGGGASRRGNSTSYLLLYEAYIAERYTFENQNGTPHR